ncbi:MAG: YicC family protein [Candidatus Omnitrophica bacterium]|nr:YicC family protein [Candidatus Omnitrophota bacterium]
MIKGMTGFSSVEISHGAVKAVLEIRSVNHRYLDVSYFLPPGFTSLEDKIRQVVQKNISRGRVTVSMKITKKEEPTLNFNKSVVCAYIRREKEIKKEFGLQGDLALSDLIRLPGVVEVQDVEPKPGALWTSAEKGIVKALNLLTAMRLREGKSIVRDIQKQMNCMSAGIKTIRTKEKNILAQEKQKMTAEEFESFQNGIDINEELSRLAHHIDEARRLLKSNEAVGKRIDFIAQEMQREANTTGSKFQDKVVSSIVISLKSSIEKLREQAQNIE